MRTLPLGCVFALSISVSACGADDSKLCTAEARVSVAAQVVDASNDPDLMATVMFSHDGQAFKPAKAEGDGFWITGYETAGLFILKATSADGSLTTEAGAVVESDGCHVETQNVMLQLHDAASSSSNVEP